MTIFTDVLSYLNLKHSFDLDKPHTDTRLTVYMDSFEFHVYNKSATYSRLEHLFGLDQFMVPGSYRKEDESKTESKR